MTLLGNDSFPSMGCDWKRGCPAHITVVPTDNVEEMRSVLAAHGWRMDALGDLVRDGISGQDLIGYKTYCPQHKGVQK